MAKRRDQDLGLLASRYKVTIDLYVFAETADDAEDLVNDLIKDIKLTKSDLGIEDPIDEYDICDIESS